MDEVPLPLRPALKSPYLTDEEVLKRIIAAVQKKPAWQPLRSSAKIPPRVRPDAHATEVPP